MNRRALERLLSRWFPVIFLALTVTGSAAALESASSSFEDLDPVEQKLLAPMREDWARLPQQRREHLLRGAKTWRSMSPAERRIARKRLGRWKSLSPEKRQRLLKRLQRYKSLPPAARAKLRATHKKFRALPRDERIRLRRQWQNADPAERREMRRRLFNRGGGE